MQTSERKTVFIEHCTNCKAHKWCTSHKEDKYHEFFAKDELINPRLGSFEITFMNKKIFSKLLLGIWPNSAKIVMKIRDLLAGNEVTDYNNYKPPNKSNETQNLEDVSTFKRVRQLDQGFEKTNKGKTDAFTHEKNKHSSSLPREQPKKSNNIREVSLNPAVQEKKQNKDVKKAENKPYIPENFIQKEPKKRKIMRKYKSGRGLVDPEKAEVVAIQNEEKTTFTVNKPRSIEKIISNKSIPRQASEKEVHKKDEEEYYQDDFEVNNEEDKKKRKSVIKQEEDKKKAVENDQNYDGNAHDYEENEYENEGFESPVEQPIQFYEGENEKKKEEIVEKNPSENEYAQDFEEAEEKKPNKKPGKKKKSTKAEAKKVGNSSKTNLQENPSQKNLPEGNEKPKNQPESNEKPSSQVQYQRPETQGNHSQSQGKRSKNQNAAATKQNSQEEIDNEKYKQFVAKLEKFEYPDRKAATFQIAIGQDIKKRITIPNEDSETANYKVFSSSLVGLEITTPDLVIGPEEKGKLGLLFKKHDIEEEKVYTVFIFKNKEPMEKIVLTTKYVSS